jgi:uncharacterized OB-fold protein
MTWEPRPLPDITPETEFYWEGAAEECLLVAECENCGLQFLYPRARCPDCFGEASPAEVEPRGEIYSYSVVEQLEGWPESKIPVIVAYVELDAGPRFITNVVDADPQNISIGTRVRAKFIRNEAGDIAVPVFTPSTATE